jgi:hypothetical protein
MKKIQYILAYKSTRIKVELIKYLLKSDQKWKIFTCFKYSFNNPNHTNKQEELFLDKRKFDSCINLIKKILR